MGASKTVASSLLGRRGVENALFCRCPDKADVRSGSPPQPSEAAAVGRGEGMERVESPPNGRRSGAEFFRRGSSFAGEFGLAAAILANKRAIVI